MGSFVWDNPCYLQYYNGRPLSVALTEPFEPEISPCIQSDFALEYRPRSQSSGRRFQHESYRIYHPNVQYTSFCYSPPFPCRQMNRCCSRDAFIEKLETVTIEEQQCRPSRGIISYVRTPSPPVRQVKIRSRPSSCVNLHNREATDNQQWIKVVDEHHEENYQYHYNYNIPSDRIVPIRHDTTAAEDYRVSITKPVRPITRDVGTTTVGLPKRPLSISETQVVERYEKNEKVRRDSITDTGSTTYITSQRPLQRSYDDDDFDDKTYHRTSKKIHRKDFVQRMHARNGTGLRSFNSLNIYSDRGKNGVIIRPTAKPREALVDTPSIVAPPGDLSEPATPIIIENTLKSRSYFQTT